MPTGHLTRKSKEFLILVFGKVYLLLFSFKRCHFEYMSRTQNSQKLNFSGNIISVDQEEGVDSNNWKLVTFTASTGSRRYMFDGYNQTFPFVLMNFNIERQSGGYVHQVMIPAVILVVINIFLLLVNPESMERFALYVINLFSHGVFLEQLRWM